MMANILPDSTLAEQHRKQAEPGSAAHWAMVATP
jgi:hypothetical protein